MEHSLTSGTGASYASVLRNRGFFLLTLAYGVNTFGNWATVVAAVGLLAFKWNASPLALAGLIAVFIAPSALLAPLAGWATDRGGRKRALIAANLAGAALILGMLAVQELWQAYLLLFAVRAVTSVNPPAMAAMVPGLVPREQVLAANALILQPAHLTRALSPVLAGALIVGVGISGAFILNALTYVVSAVIIGNIDERRDGAAAPQQPRGVALPGIVTVLRSRRIALLIVLAAAGSFASGGLQSIVPVYVRELLAGEPVLYGASISALGSGSVVGGLVAGRLSQRWDRLSTVTAAMVVTGAGLLVIAGVQAQATFLLGIALAGLGAGAALAAGQTLVHEEAPSVVHGAALGTMWAISNTFILAGIFLGGLLVTATGILATSWGLALSILAAAMVVAELTRQQRRRQAEEVQPT